MPKDWNLAYFGYSAMNLGTPIVTRLKLLSYYPLMHALGRDDLDPASIARIYRRGFGRYWKKAGWFNDAHAYAMDARAAKHVLELQSSISLEADVATGTLVRFGGLNAICMNEPSLSQCADLPSMIGARASWA